MPVHPKLREALRDGSVSMKTARKIAGPAEFSNKTLRATRVQPSKMAKFHNPERDEGTNKRSAYGKGEIDEHATQNTGRHGMPSKDRGAVTSPYGKSRGSHFSEGSGGVVGRDTPERDHIDDYPRKQGVTFPAGKKFAGGYTDKTGNTKMKGKQPLKSGGPEGHNAKSPRYYGGPNNRSEEGSY
jgi:hypothetical protein